LQRLRALTPTLEMRINVFEEELKYAPQESAAMSWLRVALPVTPDVDLTYFEGLLRVLYGDLVQCNDNVSVSFVPVNDIMMRKLCYRTVMCELQRIV
jgi:hypothetical protein